MSDANEAALVKLLAKNPYDVGTIEYLQWKLGTTTRWRFQQMDAKELRGDGSIKELGENAVGKYKLGWEDPRTWSKERLMADWLAHGGKL